MCLNSNSECSNFIIYRMLRTQGLIAHQTSFNQSFAQLSPGKSSYRRQQPLEVGDLDNIHLVQSMSIEQADQLQNDIRTIINKTPTPQWFVMESAENKLKALELFQTGVAYMHYANKTRKDLLKDMRAENERRLKDLKNRKKKLRAHREELYQLKQDYHIKKQALKEYKAYLEKLHYCKKCKRLVRNIKDHERRHEKEAPSTSSINPASKDLVATLLAENQRLMKNMEKLAEEKTLTQQGMKKLFDELRTIKLEVGELGRKQVEPSPPVSPAKLTSKESSKANVAIGTSQIDRSKDRIIRPPSIQRPKPGYGIGMDDAGLVSPVPRSPRQPEQDLQIAELLQQSLKLGSQIKKPPQNKYELKVPERNALLDPSFLDNLDRSRRPLKQEEDEKKSASASKQDILPNLDDMNNSNHPHRKSLLASDSENQPNSAKLQPKILIQQCKSDHVDEYGGEQFEDEEDQPKKPQSKPLEDTPIPELGYSLSSRLNLQSKIVRPGQMSTFGDLAQQSHPPRRKPQRGDEKEHEMISELTEKGTIMASVYKHPSLAGKYGDNRLNIDVTLSMDDESSGIRRADDMPDTLLQSRIDRSTIRKVTSPKHSETKKEVNGGKEMPEIDMFMTKSDAISMPNANEIRNSFDKLPDLDHDYQQSKIIRPPVETPIESTNEEQGEFPDIGDLLKSKPIPQKKVIIEQNLEDIPEQHTENSLSKHMKNNSSSGGIKGQQIQQESLLALTPKNKITLREFLDKVARLREESVNNKDREYQQEMKRFNDCIESQYNKEFNKEFQQLNELDLNILKARYSLLNNTVAKQRETYEQQHRAALAAPKKSNFNLQQSLEISQSAVQVPAFKSLSKNSQKKQMEKAPPQKMPQNQQSTVYKIPSDLQNLKEDSKINVIKRPSLGHYVPPQANSVINPKNTLRKEIKQFDIDDPLQNVSEQVLEGLKPSRRSSYQQSFDS